MKFLTDGKVRNERRYDEKSPVKITIHLDISYKKRFMTNSTTSKKIGKFMSTRTMTAILAAISYILAFLEFPVPLSPAFARMDYNFYLHQLEGLEN